MYTAEQQYGIASVASGYTYGDTLMSCSRQHHLLKIVQNTRLRNTTLPTPTFQIKEEATEANGKGAHDQGVRGGE